MPRLRVPGPNDRITGDMLTIEEWHALRLSFQVATCAALFGLPFAVAVGYWLARSPGRGKWLVEVLVNLPLVLPPVVVGYLLLVGFSPRARSGRALGLVRRQGRVYLVGSGHGLRRGQFPAHGPRDATCLPGDRPAAGDGGPEPGRRTAAEFPHRQPAPCTAGADRGCVLGFARSLGEFGATIMVAGNIEGQTRTIPLAIYSLTGQPGGMERLGGWWAWRSSSPAGRWASASGWNGGGPADAAA